MLADDTASTGAALSLPLITAMTSGAKPAVDGVNGKLTVYGGVGQAIGTITTPLGHSFGLQVDMDG